MIKGYRAVIRKFLRREHPELSHMLWHAERFVPDHCPNCGRNFPTNGGLYYLALDPMIKRQYRFSEPYRVVDCPHCKHRTAVVEIESRAVRTRKQAARLVRKHGFTHYFDQLVTKRGFDAALARPHELAPLGIGLAITGRFKPEDGTELPPRFWNSKGPKPAPRRVAIRGRSLVRKHCGPTG